MVYTPNEIVKFMIEGADWLTQKHFGKALIDRDVEILDPATGTGTFICELLEHFRGQPQKLAHKYKEELHANEVAILPYYVANLNIEATYAAITGQYAEFPSLCFVDTLDNVSGLGIKRGHQHDLFAGMSEENIERVKRQNRKKISVVIGNPPYNANQQNENDNNKNRTYPHIDAAIKATYIAQSRSHKTKLYDMYARFFRWASDRLGDAGILAFVTNRSFVESRTFDGFRRSLADDFAEIYVVDLGGDIRANPSLSGTVHNVFGIQAGVAITFLVKTPKSRSSRINYIARPTSDTAEEKLAFLSRHKLADISFERVQPDSAANWISVGEADYGALLPLATSKLSSRSATKDRYSIFSLSTYGALSLRDAWVFDVSRENLFDKLGFYVDHFNAAQAALERPLADGWEQQLGSAIKWSQDARKRLKDGERLSVDPTLVVQSSYRPFSKRWYYMDPKLNWSLSRLPEFFGADRPNVSISFSDTGARADFMALATQLPADIHFGASIDAYQQIARYRYTDTGERIDNITTWAENKFTARYGKSVTKDDIFAYVYAVLHDPIYREKYAINLKREFPRIPIYLDFRQWVDWGQKLLDLHIGYESVEPWPLKRLDTPDEKAREAGLQPKAMLKADKDNGAIRLDSETVLSGIPPEVWDYKLGNRSGVEWVLDQYKEKTPKDPTIREKFNTYRFADYKEKVVDLIGRVTRVSVETMAISGAMKGAQRDDDQN